MTVSEYESMIAFWHSDWIKHDIEWRKGSWRILPGRGYWHVYNPAGTKVKKYRRLENAKAYVDTHLTSK